MDEVTFRNSFKYVRATLTTRLAPTLLVLIAVEGWMQKLPTFIFWGLLSVLGMLMIAAFLEPVFAARFVTLTVGEETVTRHSGWLFPQARTILISEITSVQVSEPFIQRTAKLKSVSIVTSGATDSALEMPALTHDDSQQLETILNIRQGTDVREQQLTSPVQQAESPEGPQAKTVEHETTTYFRAGVRDIIATAMASGYPLIVIALVIGTAQDIASASTCLLSVDGVDWHSPLLWVLMTVLLAIVVAGMTASKYWKFRIQKTSAGDYLIAYGAIERVHHTIMANQLVSIRLIRSPVDLIFGTTRVELSTAQFKGDKNKDLVFPSLVSSRVEDLLSGLVERPLPGLQASPWTIKRALGTVGLVVVLMVLLPKFNILARVGVGLGLLMLSVTVVQYLFAKVVVDADSGDLFWHDGALSSRSIWYARGSVTGVIERSVPGLPVANVSLVGWAHDKVSHRYPTINRNDYEAVYVAICPQPSQGDATTAEGIRSGCHD